MDQRWDFLTVVGYSINDTIVIFDRIRENLGFMKKNDMDAVINTSINQTLVRSLMTSFTTFVVMVPLYLLTGTAIREFTLPLMVGVLTGCVSSITICSPLYRDLCRFTEKEKYQGKRTAGHSKKLKNSAQKMPEK